MVQVFGVEMALVLKNSITTSIPWGEEVLGMLGVLYRKLRAEALFAHAAACRFWHLRLAQQVAPAG